MPRRCEIPNCSVEPGEAVFSLPSDPIIRKKWIIALCNVYPNLHLRKNVFICEKHFKSKDFSCVITDSNGKIIQQAKTQKKRLKKGAIPHFIDTQSHGVSNTSDMITDSFQLIAAPKTETSTSDVTETGGIIQISRVKEKCLEPKRNISDVESGEIIKQDHYSRITFTLTTGRITELENCLSELEKINSTDQVLISTRKTLEDLNRNLVSENDARKRNDNAEALRCINRCIEISPSCIDYKLRKARYLVYMERYEEADTIANDILENDRKNSSAKYILSIHIYYTDIEKALPYLKDIIQQSPEMLEAQTLYHKARILKGMKEKGNEAFRCGEFAKAHDFYTRATKIDPKYKKINKQLYNNMAQASYKLGRRVTSIKECTKALEIDNNYLKALARRGKCYMELKNYSSAIDDFQKCCQIDEGIEYKNLLDEAKKRQEEKERVEREREEKKEERKRREEERQRKEEERRLWDEFFENKKRREEKERVEREREEKEEERKRREEERQRKEEERRRWDEFFENKRRQEEKERVEREREEKEEERKRREEERQRKEEERRHRDEFFESCNRNRENWRDKSNYDRHEDERNQRNSDDKQRNQREEYKERFSGGRAKSGSYYAILGVNKNASLKDIKAAYMKLAKTHHPDRHVNSSKDVKEENERKMKLITQAYRKLTEAEKKWRGCSGRDKGCPRQNTGFKFA